MLVLAYVTSAMAVDNRPRVREELARMSRASQWVTRIYRKTQICILQLASVSEPIMEIHLTD